MTSTGLNDVTGTNTKPYEIWMTIEHVVIYGQ